VKRNGSGTARASGRGRASRSCPAAQAEPEAPREGDAGRGRGGPGRRRPHPPPRAPPPPPPPGPRTWQESTRPPAPADVTTDRGRALRTWSASDSTLGLGAPDPARHKKARVSHHQPAAQARATAFVLARAAGWSRSYADLESALSPTETRDERPADGRGHVADRPLGHSRASR
jgi:hypothetical protein